jgi:predicted GNAT family acetyltransferase
MRALSYKSPTECSKLYGPGSPIGKDLERPPESFDLSPMQLSEFITYHQAVLETDEARHNVILSVIERGREDPGSILWWSLGEPGHCAVQIGRKPIILGELDEAQCEKLADLTTDIAYPGVIGPGSTAKWFVQRAASRGLQFLDPMPQQIYALRDKPKYPDVAGYPREAGSADISLILNWIRAFATEATPHDPVPTREQIENSITNRKYLLWIIDGQPVSMAAIARRTRNSAAINAVFTPPSLRGRRYAQSITAAVAERIFAEGKNVACLYTDLRNPYSNRCYTKIGFEPISSSFHFSANRT